MKRIILRVGTRLALWLFILSLGLSGLASLEAGELTAVSLHRLWWLAGPDSLTSAAWVLERLGWEALILPALAVPVSIFAGGILLALSLWQRLTEPRTKGLPRYGR